MMVETRHRIVSRAKQFWYLWWEAIAAAAMAVVILLALMGAEADGSPGPLDGQVVVPNEPTVKWCEYFSHAEGVDEEGTLVGPVVGLDCVSSESSTGVPTYVSYKFAVTEDMVEAFLEVFGDEQDTGFVVQ